MTDMPAAVLMDGANGAHTVSTLSARVTHCPPPPVARKLGYPSWKVIVSAYMATASSRARKSPAFFRAPSDAGDDRYDHNVVASIQLHARQPQRVADHANERHAAMATTRPSRR